MGSEGTSDIVFLVFSRLEKESLPVIFIPEENSGNLLLSVKYIPRAFAMDVTSEILRASLLSLRILSYLVITRVDKIVIIAIDINNSIKVNPFIFFILLELEIGRGLN